MPHSFITASFLHYCNLRVIVHLSFPSLFVKINSLSCKALQNIVRYFMQSSKKVKVSKAKNFHLEISK